MSRDDLAALLRRRSLTNEQLDDLRRRITNAVRFVGRKKTAVEMRELKRFMDSFFGVWLSESVQKALANWTAAEQDREFVIWRTQSRRAVKDRPAEEQERALLVALAHGIAKVKSVRRLQQQKSRAPIVEKFAERDEWLREEFAEKRGQDSRYEESDFRIDLEAALDAIRRGGRRRRDPATMWIPPKFVKLLRHNRELISLKRLKRILRQR